MYQARGSRPTRKTRAEKLSRLERVDVRETWPNEEHDFTPWLASDRGLQLLSEWLGLLLEQGVPEVEVGQFRADVVCRDFSVPEHPTTVVIENQLGPSDHDHLGKLLTYANGLQADTGIWIATDFAPEHLDAVSAWNSPPDRTVDLYCVQLATWRIGRSRDIAATFNVVVRPDAPYLIAAQFEPSAIDTNILDQFWSRFHDVMTTKGPGWEPIHTRYETYRSFDIGHPAACLSVVRDFDIGRNRARLYIYKGNDLVYRELERDRRLIDRELGDRTDWNDGSEDSERSSIDLRCPAHLYDRSKWDEEIEWMIDKLLLLDRVFRRRLEVL